MGWARRSRSVPAAASVDRYFELCLLGVVASGYLALLGSGFLDAPSRILGGACVLARALVVAGIVRLDLPRRTVTALALAGLSFFALDATLLSRDLLAASVHCAFLLAGLNLLTARGPRDYALISVSASFAMLAAAVLSASLSFFMFLTLFLVCGIAALASAEIRRSLREPHAAGYAGVRWFPLRLAAASVWMACGVFLLTGGLFFILPRTVQAAFRRLLPRSSSAQEFSSEVRLGAIGELRPRPAAVMRVRILDAAHPEALKWRGLALSHFDGRRWYNRAEPGTALAVEGGLIQLAGLRQQWRKGERINYEVRLNPMATDALFFAGRPEFVRIDSPALIQTSGDGYRLGGPHLGGLRYGAYSFLEETADPAEGAGSEGLTDRMACLELPPLDPRVAGLARRIAEGAPDEAARARAVESYLRRNYRYSTRLLEREVPDPLAYFLFERREGHCEYFASAMAVMLRRLGVPSRVVTGFESGVYNPVSGWWVIRASDAHSWVEAYLPGRGWTAFDPTPPAARQPAASPWARLGFYLDAAETFWQEWVLDYNLGRQLVLASRMQDSGRSFGARWLDGARRGASQTAAAVGQWLRRYGLLAIALVLLAVLWRRLGPKALVRWRAAARLRQAQRGRARPADATLLYQRMLRALKRRGFEKPAWITAGEFARRLPATATAALVREFTAAYHDMRFGGQLDAAARMAALLEAIEQRGRV
ncbi:MAG: DUF3488 and transglutaminase-like domain-containing protein [Bryobacteraceae bacterium]